MLLFDSGASVARLRRAPGFALSVALLFGSLPASADAPSSGEWRYPAGDAANTRYAPLSQIDPSNVGTLENVWAWDSPDEALIGTATRERPAWFKVTPLYVDGVLFTGTSFNQVAAIDPATGKSLWVFDPKAYLKPASSGWQTRGIAYWSGRVEGKQQARLLIAAANGELICVDAAAGRECAGFGSNGRVDLQAAIIRNETDRKSVGFNSPPLVVGDIVVVGGSIVDAHRDDGWPAGQIQAFDVHTGKSLWRFHNIPLPGQKGYDTWLNDSAKQGGAANAWAPLSADLKRGIIYAATATPANDFYGGARPGDNLYAESVLAIDARNGKLRWHFQAIHHGLWDYDFPAAPTLVDITVNGKRIEAVAQISKQGFTYIFDRVTGKPVWPIEERPVARSSVPGERSSPTQPFPTRPPAFARQGVSMEDLIDFTPELHAEAKQIVDQYVIGPLFTPPIVRGHGKKGLMMAPSSGGGANWGGAGFDPDTGYLYLDVADTYAVMAVDKRKPTAGAAPRENDYAVVDWMYIGPQVKGLPLLKPPYGSVVAIDLNAGDIAWKVPHGDGPRDHPEIKHLNLPPLGATRMLLSGSGPLVTKTLLFMNQMQTPGMALSNSGFFLRAFDKRSGEVLWEHEMDVAPTGVPMTYMHQGRQYIVVAVGGAGKPAQLRAFATSATKVEPHTLSNRLTATGD